MIRLSAMTKGILAAAAIAAASLANAESLQVFGKERLAASGQWTAHECKFTPAAEGRPAVLDLSPVKWSALIASLPLDRKLKASFSLSARCRWASDFSKVKHAAAGVVFLDAEEKALKGSGAFKPIALKEGWQDLQFETSIPAGAESVRIEIASHAGASLEIADLSLELIDVELSDAAASGVEMPWLKVPGAKGGLAGASPEGATASFVEKQPYSFESPIWNELKSYPIPTTSCNKTPLNDVSASFQAAWTKDALFVRFRAHDGTLNFKDSSRYLRDCFELFLMPSRQGDNSPGKEQYTITRSEDGSTSANTEAISRITPDGWEAIVKIPLKTELRRIEPFNGLALTFNAAYQDANVQGQEHWLSFSKKDQTNSSWCKPSLYVPLVFQTPNAEPYRPLWLGDSADYNVDPKFPGRLSLVRGEASTDNVSIWGEPEAQLEDFEEGGRKALRIKFPQDASRRCGLSFPPFDIIPEETLDLELEARSGAGGAKAPSFIFLARSCWLMDGFGSKGKEKELGRDWTKLEFSIKIGSKYRENMRSGRLLMFLDAQPGKAIEIRNLRLSRRLPVDFDAAIEAPGRYSHFWDGEKASLRFKFAAGEPVATKIEASVSDFFTGEKIASKSWTQEIQAGEDCLDWELPKIPNGFFNVALKARKADGGFLADRELYISKGVNCAKASSFSGLFIGSNFDLPPPQAPKETAEMTRKLGISMSYWGELHLFDGKGRELPGDATAAMRAFKEAGFTIGSELGKGGSHESSRAWQPEELDYYYDRSFAKCEGLVDFWNFANEPNLYMDAREWAVYCRGFYNALKKNAPKALPVFGCTNRVPSDYFASASVQNGLCFGDGVLGVHDYGLEPNNEEGFKNLIESRRELERLYPGWKVWDTESGLVRFSFRSALDLQSKKAPILLCAGFQRSYYFQIWDLLFPFCDSTPLVPMEAFKNSFYMDAVPVGRMTTAGGKIQLYLFKGPSGEGRAAFWNTSMEEASLELPALAGAERFDVFGNSLGRLEPGAAKAVLKDRQVNYATGLDLETLSKDASFTAAFAPSQAEPAAPKGVCQSVYLSLPNVANAFDLELAKGQESSVAACVRNCGSTERRVRLACKTPEGLEASVDGGAEIELKPGELRNVSVKLLAGRELAKEAFSLAGSLEDEATLAPIVFTVKTAPPACAAGYTRSIEIKNVACQACEIEATPAKESTCVSKLKAFFKPASIKAKLGKGESATSPIQVSIEKGIKEGLNVPVQYDVNLKWPQGDCRQRGAFMIFSPLEQSEAGQGFDALPFSAIPEQPGAEKFQADYSFSWSDGKLRVIAKVHDSSPRQDNLNGDLKTGGDCMIMAFDVQKGKGPSPFGAGYFECGFAWSHQAPSSYVWDGRYGLEAAKPFPEAVRRVARDAEFVYYDVEIPLSKIFPEADAKEAGMSIAFVNRGKDGKDQIIELGQGIFPARAPEKLGLLRK